ncbi:Com family DNA-binding transcriptional regulator [Candidatus Uhrbacteria bacterium]|nr:Com family DNA-binding transcriptional regulator [Candidatus Uhrbacteria bacterium]
MPCLIKEHRCRSCHKLLFKGALVEGEVEIKCRSCHELNRFMASQFNDLLCLIPNCPGRISFQPQPPP